ncbi:type IV pilus biogenesis protein PilM [Liberiplasma polymorphum]|uniref:type IV pilus biogenesis protein PilM n=1 Tax=Liberiplasma polymorphum TaxID=3374570 RepID=UPI003774F082
MARSVLNVFFTDREVSFIEKPDGYNMKKLKYSSVELEPGIIENGVIYREERLLKILKDTFKMFKIRARRVNLIVHEELFTFRKIEVPIIYKPNEIGDYIRQQMEKMIMVPFKDMKMDYVIHRKNEDHYEVIMFYAPQNELKSYVSLFYNMNMQVVRTDIPPLSLHRLFYYRKNEDSDLRFEKDVMFMAVFDQTYSLYIFDEEIPLFSLVQNIQAKTLTDNKYLELLDSEIGKIANYYKYNLNAGEREINRVIVFNMTSRYTNEFLTEYFHDEEMIRIFDMKKASKIVDTLIDRECYIPLAASLVTQRGLW